MRTLDVSRRLRNARVPVAVVLLVLVLGAGAAMDWGTSVAAFVGKTVNPGNAFSAAPTFPTYPASVLADGPSIEHHLDEGPSASQTSAVVDSSGNNLAGSYAGQTNGASTWWTFDETSGTTAADSSGSADPGSLNNGPVWGGAGHIDGELAFDGVDDAVVGAGPGVTTTSDFSVSTWVYLAATGSNRTAVSQAGSVSSGFILRSTAAGKWQFSLPRTDVAAPTVDSATSTASVATNTWTHLAGVVSGTSMQLYVNGVADGSAVHPSGFNATGALTAGRARLNSAPAEFWSGRLDDLRVYRRALSAADVTSIYGTNTTVVLPASTTQWAFDEGTGTSVADGSGSANPGTLAAGATWNASGQSGTAVTTSGTSTGYVSGTKRGVDSAASFSVSLWVNPTATGPGVRSAVSLPGSIQSGFSVGMNADKWVFNAGITDALATGGPPPPPKVVDTAQSPPGTAIAGTWTHLVAVYNAPAKMMYLYVNGAAPVSTKHTAAFTAAGPLQAGRDLTNSVVGDYWTGSIDDIRLFPSVLTGGQVNSIYYAGAPTATLPTDDNTHWALNEGTGTSTVDSSGSGNTGTLATGASWNATGVDGSAVTTNGTTGYVNGTTAPVNTATSFSVSAWLNTAATGPGTHAAVSLPGVNQSGFTLGGEADKYTFSMTKVDTAPDPGPGGTDKAGSAPATAVVGAWAHVVGVYDASAGTAKIYVNGNASGSVAHTSGFTATGPLQLGRDRNDAAWADFWNGSIDDVRTYSRALSAGEIRALYNDLLPPAVSPSDPVMQWPFDEGTGTIAADSSGSGNTGTLGAGATWDPNGNDASAVALPGTTTGYVAGTSRGVDTNTSFSVSAWASVATTGPGTRTAVSLPGVNQSGFRLQQEADKWTLELDKSDAAGAPVQDKVSSGPGTAVAGTWTHLVGVYDATSSRALLYVNGTLAATVAHSVGFTAAGPVQVGRDRTSAAWANPFTGSIDDVQLYTRALSQSEVSGLAQNIAPADLPNDMTAGLPGVLVGSSSTAVAFAGTTNGYNNTVFNNPTTFTTEGWFKVSGTSGGTLAAFGNTATGISSTSDRTSYIDSSGKLRFVTKSGTTVTSLVSSASVNDGAWHYAAASLGAAGMRLYLDGALVASNATTTAGNYAGYFRFGGATLTGFPSRPGNDYLIGTLDELAVYSTQLTDQQVAWHYHANH
jgi:hypothetical protein